MTNIKDEFTEKAQTVKLKCKSRSWVKRCAIAICLCLAVGAWPKGSQAEVKEIGSLDEIASSYDSNLLIKKLAASGARTTSIHLSYASGGNVSNPAAWNTLAIPEDYNGQDSTLDCDFDSEEDEKKQSKPIPWPNMGIWK